MTNISLLLASLSLRTTYFKKNSLKVNYFFFDDFLFSWFFSFLILTSRCAQGFSFFLASSFGLHRGAGQVWTAFLPASTGANHFSQTHSSQSRKEGCLQRLFLLAQLKSGREREKKCSSSSRDLSEKNCTSTVYAK